MVLILKYVKISRDGTLPKWSAVSFNKYLNAMMSEEAWIVWLSYYETEPIMMYKSHKLINKLAVEACVETRTAYNVAAQVGKTDICVDNWTPFSTW